MIPLSFLNKSGSFRDYMPLVKGGGANSVSNRIGGGPSLSANKGGSSSLGGSTGGGGSSTPSDQWFAHVQVNLQPFETVSIDLSEVGLIRSGGRSARYYSSVTGPDHINVESILGKKI